MRRTDDGPAHPIDATMNAAIRGVAATAAALSVIVVLAFGTREALGTSIGGLIATANLYVFARIGEAFLRRRGTTSWTMIAIVKLVVLFGGIWLLLRSGRVSGIWLAVGYASLPIGITLGSLFAREPDPEPEPPAEPPPDPESDSNDDPPVDDQEDR